MPFYPVIIYNQTIKEFFVHRFGLFRRNRQKADIFDLKVYELSIMN